MTQTDEDKKFSVFLVDDDAGVLRALSRLVRTAGYDVVAFDSPQAFLDRHDPAVPGCAIFDLAMPGIDGLQLQAALLEKGVARAVIFVTGKGEIPDSVRAIQNGAIDFLTKPVDAQGLLRAIRRAHERDAHVRATREEMDALHALVEKLTPREYEVLTHVIAGRLNKQIAGDLGTVEKTIKVHRGRMMDKMGVRSVAELVRLADKVGIQPYRPVCTDTLISLKVNSTLGASAK
ncbi:MAG TPA: response regulator [Xanthobacteraceae bacterium]|nr:response regulator [Xanthobacteraceae bacterium]